MIWDVVGGERLATLRGHETAVTSVVWSPDGSQVVSASASGDTTVGIWDASSHQRIGTLHGHKYSVNAVAFSPNGTRLVSASGTVSEHHIRVDDNALFVWDVTTGKRLAALVGHLSEVRAVAFSPDGSRIISGSADGTIKVWEADTFTESHTFQHPPDGVEIATITGHTAAGDRSRLLPGRQADRLRIPRPNRPELGRGFSGTARVRCASALRGWSLDLDLKQEAQVMPPSDSPADGSTCGFNLQSRAASNCASHFVRLPRGTGSFQGVSGVLPWVLSIHRASSSIGRAADF